MLPPPSTKYAGFGPLTLAKLTHKAEDEEDDIEFLAIQDAVSRLTHTEQDMYRDAYIHLHKKH
jgi:hypothetical protein